jgi:hypothetical protein
VKLTCFRPWLRMALFVPLLGLILVGVSPFFIRTLLADSLPQVQLNADSITPRPIEDLTGKNVTRDYANAWKTLAEALEQNRPGALNAYFTGFAKDGLTSRVSDQRKSGIHTRYVDRGHRVKAVFYAADGGEMQLIDEAKLEIEVFDGDKSLSKEAGTHNFLVLMTPGADRWFVRGLQQISEEELESVQRSR